MSVEDTPIGRRLFATRPFAEDDILTSFAEHFVAEPTIHTIQVDTHRHLDTAGNPGAFANHSCAPNSRFVADSYQLLAAEAIPRGGEVTLNYLCFEWDMSSPFSCRCGVATCFGTIRGFRYLSQPDQQQLLPLALPYLHQLKATGW